MSPYFPANTIQSKISQLYKKFSSESRVISDVVDFIELEDVADAHVQNLYASLAILRDTKQDIASAGYTAIQEMINVIETYHAVRRNGISPIMDGTNFTYDVTCRSQDLI